jgi:dethiobiotin synthetase
MIDLIKDLDAPALLVSPSRLGSINDTLLSRMALDSKNIDYFWYVNLYEDKGEFTKITAPFYEECVGEVPTDLGLVFDRYLHRYAS